MATKMIPPSPRAQAVITLNPAAEPRAADSDSPPDEAELPTPGL
jgi:hypothetical protein